MCRRSHLAASGILKVLAHGDQLQYTKVLLNGMVESGTLHVVHEFDVGVVAAKSQP